MSDNKTNLLKKLVEIAEEVKDASLLLSTGFKIRHPELFEEAVQIFGTWEVTLAQLVLGLRDKEQLYAPKVDSPTASDEPTFISREPSEGADDPVWGVSSTGDIGLCRPSSLPLSIWLLRVGPLTS